MGNLTLSSFGILCIAITLGSFGQVFLKMGLGPKGIAGGAGILQTVANIAMAMLHPWVLAGLSLYVISTFFWLVVISKVRLSVAYPLISMSYPLVVVLAAVMLPGEHPRWPFAIAGLAFISVGVSFIGFGLGKSGKVSDQCKG